MTSNKILVVEDEALVAFEIMATLRGAGLWAVGPTPTVSAALEALEGEEFDAVLLDINLHGIPSFPVADALRRKAIPFAFVTAYSRVAVPDELRNAPLLGKPYHNRQLLSVALGLLEMPQGC